LAGVIKTKPLKTLVKCREKLAKILVNLALAEYQPDLLGHPTSDEGGANAR
jgi:hypothetical protein